MIEEFLTFSGMPVVGAENGKEGLQALQKHRPCLIFLDLSMPVMDGWRFREEQKRLSEKTLANVPVVIVSALPDCERHAEALGAVECLHKPVDFDRLIMLAQEYREHGGES